MRSLSFPLTRRNMARKKEVIWWSSLSWGTDSPACWKLAANHRSWSRRWLLLHRHGQKWQQRLNYKPQEVKRLDHSIIPLFSEAGRKERRCELLQRKQLSYPESQPGTAGAGGCPYRGTSERENFTKTCSTLHKLNVKSQFRIQSLWSRQQWSKPNLS